MLRMAGAQHLAIERDGVSDLQSLGMSVCHWSLVICAMLLIRMIGTSCLSALLMTVYGRDLRLCCSAGLVDVVKLVESREVMLQK